MDTGGLIGALSLTTLVIVLAIAALMQKRGDLSDASSTGNPVAR